MEFNPLPQFDFVISNSACVSGADVRRRWLPRALGPFCGRIMKDRDTAGASSHRE
ncbi:hypothetical protein [Streptomyces sp. NPDC001820]|uniref:hypothetical protein n=1 Tax=Streptomyces sp. NPDC001820 TaxID=3364613 RepID=UPI0036A38206